MFETMALPQPPGPLCRITILRWTRYALALDDKLRAFAETAFPSTLFLHRIALESFLIAEW
jgi:hypothetical protein